MRNYQWLEVTKDVGKYVNRCDICQRMKNHLEALPGKLMANEVLEKLQMYLIVDFITIFPLVIEKDIILVICDKLSKMTYFVATTEGTCESCISCQKL